MFNGFRPASALAALGISLTLLGGSAQAMPDAQIDQAIRPNFNLLLSPPLRPAYRPAPWTVRRGTPDYGLGRRPPLLLNSITVDCGDPRYGPAPLNEALYNLADNGVLYIRSRGGVCHETLLIDHPVIIAGEGVPTFATGANPEPAKLQPRANAPCIRIAPGVKGVEIRDLVIEADQAGRSACIESLDADVALVRTLIRYQGDAAGVFAQGGRLIVRSSTIEARTNAAAVVADGAQVDFSQVRLVADVRGLDVTPALGTSRLTQVGILAVGQGLPGGVGITIRDQRSGSGELVADNIVLKGWVTGAYVDRGAKFEITNSRILKGRRGIISDFGQVKIRQNAIEADEFAALFSSGQPELMHNRFIGGPVDFDRGVEPLVEPNIFYAPRNCRVRLPKGVYCRPIFETPKGIFDETGFDLPERYGWEADGYQRGYLRDGPPQPFGWSPPPKRRGLFSWGRHRPEPDWGQ